MTQPTQTLVGAEPGPRPSPDRDLYTPLDWALIRAPLLPARALEDVSSVVAPAGETSLLPRDPRVRAAIQVGSPDLAAALGRTHPGDPEARRVGSKLTRYLLRMCARPTPYGLFAGVGLIGWGTGTDVKLLPGELRTRTRPDMKWLLDFVSRLEEDPAVRARLNLRANQAVIIRGGRAFLSDDGGTSVRASRPVRRALELARAPVPYAVLAGQLLSTSPGATQDKAERLIDELMRQGFLHSDLRPPVTGTDPVSYVADRLTDIPAGRAGASGLRELASAARAWDTLPTGDRAAGWDDLLRRARRLHLSADAAHLMQTDLALPLARTRLSADIGTEAARAAGLLLSVTPHPYGAPHIHDYRHRFEARYGLDRRVPLLELLDANFGLGPPARDHVDPSFPERDAALREVALSAHRDRALVVELDDEMLGRLQTWRPGASAIPASVEIPVFIAAASPVAIDAGDYQVVVGPNIGPCAAGRSLGRFADLLGPLATAALGRAAAAEAALRPDVSAAEIAYLPRHGRMGNVLLRPAVRSREIVFSTTPGVPG